MANRVGPTFASELPERHLTYLQSRRRLLQKALTISSASGLGSQAKASPPRRNVSRALAPRVVVVGGGIAGLCAAYRLRKAGIFAQIFEAGDHLGGRIYSKKDFMAPGLTTELGGEFIDSNHKAMFVLAREFGLELLDFNAGQTQHEMYYFGGSRYTQAQVVDAFRPLATRIEADAVDLDDKPTGSSDVQTKKLDHCSLAQYLDRIAASDWIRKFIEVAYTAEFGLDPSELSALSLLTEISTDVSNGRLGICGESDERYKIKGGNQQLIDALAWQLDGQIELGHKLLSLRSAAEGFRLGFSTADGHTLEMVADHVVLTIPFSVLRQIELRVELPKRKEIAIRELGYGTNTKIFAGVRQRVWVDEGYTGSILSDEPFQTAFDNSRLQHGPQGGLTLFSGGRAGIEAGVGTAADQVDRLLVGVERGFPGVQAALNGCVGRFCWPTYPLALGSYACYKPGQYTTIGGTEGTPVGNLFFAGEHCSLGSSGFMNGAASSGLRAARLLLTKIMNPP